jgi:hypothetical protein
MGNAAEEKVRLVMAFELSFSDEFFYGEDCDFYDRRPAKTDRPTSVLQALVSMSGRRWMEMAREVFGEDSGEDVGYPEVMDRIRETNTCSDLRSPVEVWIDEDGWYRVSVYDGGST